MIVDAGGQVDRLAHAAGVFEEGDLVAVGGTGLPKVKALEVLLTPAFPANCQACRWARSGRHWGPRPVPRRCRR